MEKRFSTKMKLPRYALSIPYEERVQFHCSACDKKRFGQAQKSKKTKGPHGEPVYNAASCRVCGFIDKNSKGWTWRRS